MFKKNVISLIAASISMLSMIGAAVNDKPKFNLVEDNEFQYSRRVLNPQPPTIVTSTTSTTSKNTIPPYTMIASKLTTPSTDTIETTVAVSLTYVYPELNELVNETTHIETTTIETTETNETEPPVEVEETCTNPTSSLDYITEEERIMLCNVVAGEYGADWVPLYDKACVVACVMNRYYDGGWTSGAENTIYNVLSAPNQFDGFYANTTYNWNVTQSCIDAVEYYFQHQSDFPHYLSFYGDGTYNYFS